MTVWIEDADSKKAKDLMAEVLMLGSDGERVQFLVRAGDGGACVQRMRVELSRSRARHKKLNKPYREFTLKHHCYPYTKEGIRYDCIVMWTERERRHRLKELLADTLKD